MLSSTAPQNQITLGDPVPWFSAATVTGGSFNLQVAAGRWIVLCFPGPADGPQARQKLAELLADKETPDRCVALAHAKLSLRAIGIPQYRALYRFVAEQAAAV